VLHAKNDSARIKKELNLLRVENRALFNLIIDLYKHIDKEFGKDTIITMIYRTQEEQDDIYAFSEKYKLKPWKSPHQFWHSIDLRVFVYTEEEVKKVEAYLNDKYNEDNYYKWTAKNHKVGNGADHFHIQYVPK